MNQLKRPIFSTLARISVFSFFSSIVSFCLESENRLLRCWRTLVMIFSSSIMYVLILLKALERVVLIFSYFYGVCIQMPFCVLFQCPLLSDLCNMPVLETVPRDQSMSVVPAFSISNFSLPLLWHTFSLLWTACCKHYKEQYERT